MYLLDHANNICNFTSKIICPQVIAAKQIHNSCYLLFYVASSLTSLADSLLRFNIRDKNPMDVFLQQ